MTRKHGQKVTKRENNNIRFKQMPLPGHLHHLFFFTLCFSTTLQWLATLPTYVSITAIVSLFDRAEILHNSMFLLDKPSFLEFS